MELNGSKDCSITNDNPHFTAKQSDVTRGVIPTTNHWCQPFRILDSAEQTMCALESGYLTNGDNMVNLIVYKGNEVSSANAQIAVGFKSDGSWFTYAPTPITTDNSTKIATTAYVTSKLNEGNKPTIYTLTAGTPDGNTFYLKVEYFKVGKVVFCQQYCEIYNSNYYGDSHTSAMRVQLPVGFRPSTSSFSKGYPTQGDGSSSSYGSMAKVTSSGYAGMQVWKTNGNYAYKQMFWFTD